MEAAVQGEAPERTRARAAKAPPLRLTDLLFGVLLPLLCLLIDHALGRYAITRHWHVKPFVWLQMLVFASAMVVPPRNPTLRAMLAGALAPGALCAGAIGLWLLPFSIAGLVYVIGLLGLVPLFTCFVFARASRAWLAAARGPQQRDVLGPYAAGLALSLLPLARPVAGSLWTDREVHRVVTNESYDVESAARALWWVCDGELDAVAEAWGRSEDPAERQRLARLHELLGRGSIEERWYEISD